MKSFLRLAVSLGLMAAFLYLAFWDIDADSMWSATTDVSIPWLGAAAGMVLFTTVLRAWRWVVLLRPVAPDVTVLDATIALTIGYAINFVSPIPRTGEAARALSLRWARGVNISSAVGTIVVEHVFDLVWLILFVAISAALLPGQIEQLFPWIQTVAALTLAAAILALVGMVLVSVYQDRGVALMHRVLGLVSESLAQMVGGLLSQFIHGLTALRTPSAYLEILISSLFLNLGYVLIYWFAFVAFGFHEAPWHLGGEAAIVIMSIASIGMVLPTQGGIGTYHFFFRHSLHSLFAVPEVSALACATLIHALSNLTFVVIGIPALFLQRRRHGRRGSLTGEFEQAALDPSN